MPIAMTADQRALADAVRSWSAGRDPIAAVRAQETEHDTWRAGWTGLVGLGVLAAPLPESIGGGGGDTVDLAVALETLAAALVPGPVLTTALAALALAEAGHPLAADLAADLAAGRLTAGVAVTPAPLQATGGAPGDVALTGTVRAVPGATDDGLLVVHDGACCWVLQPGAGGRVLIALDAADFSVPLAEAQLREAPATALALAPSRLRELAATLAAAEAAGVAERCVRIAAAYAGVREQFGRPIGAFQAVKHLCTTLLCRSVAASAVAWDAAAAAGDPAAHPLAAAVAAAGTLDAAVANAEDCIQVLGGIGFTWEHEAHLYLRRAVALRQLLGGTAPWRRQAIELTLAGVRRSLHVEVDVPDERRRELRSLAVRVAAAADGPPRRVALAESGLLVPHWPAPYGLGAGPAEQLAADEELARAGVTRPDLVIAAWAVPTVLAHGSAEQIARFVAPTLRGELTWCQLFSEPGAGSDLASLRTRAERVDGGWSLTGQKVWTSLAHEADWAVCLARTDVEAPKHAGITYFLVDMRSPGIDIRPLREITGDALFNEVFLDGVVVPDELVVGEVGGGWPLARTTLSHERVAMGGASSIGDAVERLVRRAADADLLDTDPVLADRVGRCIVDGLAGSLLDLRSVLARLAGQDDGETASVRKLVGVAHRQDVAEVAVELLGAPGLAAGEELRTFLNSRCLSIAGGTTQILATLAGERALGLPRR